MIIGSRIIFHDELPSTNTEAARIAGDQGLPEGTIVQAGYQSAGRGHGKNSWTSDKGKNLLFSIILHPETVDPEHQFDISIAISLGIHDFVSRYCTNVSIKWPNDIYVGSDKIAGILIENTLLGNKIQDSIAGIGININQENFRNLAPNAVSLKIITGMDHEPGACLKEVCSCLDNRYRELLWGDNDRLRSDYISKLYRLDIWGMYRAGDSRFTAILRGISDEGKLVLEKQDHERSEYGFKEVEYIIEPKASH